jgi:hypothetical protein
VKQYSSILLFLLFFNLPRIVSADFATPLFDANVGTIVTGPGYLFMLGQSSEVKPEFGVLVWTDTGYQVIPVSVAKNIDTSRVLGRAVTITALVLNDKCGSRRLLVHKLGK